MKANKLRGAIFLLAIIWCLIYTMTAYAGFSNESDTKNNKFSVKIENNITYDLQGGQWEEGNEGLSTYIIGQEYTPPTPVREGYEFKKWNPTNITAETHGNVSMRAVWDGDYAVLVPGTKFNYYMKKVAGLNVTESNAINYKDGNFIDPGSIIKPGFAFKDGKILHFERVDLSEKPSDDSGIDIEEIQSEGCKVYLWYDSDTKTNKFASEAAKIYLNQDCRKMFLNFRSLKDFNGVAELSVSDTVDYSISQMFGDLSTLTTLDPIRGLVGDNMKWHVSSDISKLCSGLSTVKEIDALEILDTSNVTKVNEAFGYMYNLENLNGAKNWDMSGLVDTRLNDDTGTSGLGRLCAWDYSLTDISALANWDVSRLKSMREAFSKCLNLKDLSGLGNWDISSMEILDEAFFDDPIEDATPLRGWGTTANNVKSIKQMLYFAKIDTQDSKLSNLDFMDTWELPNVQSLHEAFAGNSNLKDISGLRNIKSHSITNLTGTFKGCPIESVESLRTLDVSHVEALTDTFNSGQMKSIEPLVDWNTSSLTSANRTFRYCDKLESADGIQSWIFDNVESSYGLFEGCTRLNDITALGSLNVENLENADLMLYGCSEIKDLSPLKNWTGTNLKTAIQFTQWIKADNVDYLENFLFANDEKNSIKEILNGAYRVKAVKMLRGKDLSSIKNASGLFKEMQNLIYIDLTGTNFDITGEDIFYNTNSECKSDQSVKCLIVCDSDTEEKIKDILNNATDTAALNPIDRFRFIRSEDEIYELTFDLDGGQFEKEDSNRNTYSYYESKVIDSPIKNHYMFKGWEIQDTDGNVLGKIEPGYGMPQGYVGKYILKALWQYDSDVYMDDGNRVNNKIKQYLGDEIGDNLNANYYFADYKLKSIKYSDVLPSGVKSISISDARKTANDKDVKFYAIQDSSNGLYDGYIWTNSSYNGIDAGENLNFAFSDFKELVDISGLEYIAVDRTTSMNGVFLGDAKLTDFTPIENWNTSKVTNMEQEFKACSSIENVDFLSNWDFDNVKTLKNFLYDCSSLVDISVFGKINLGTVETFDGMFRNCESLSDISALENMNLSSFDTADRWLYNTNVSDITPISNWDVSSIEKFVGLLAGTKITSLDAVSNWDMHNAKYLNRFVEKCQELEALDGISSWDIDGLISMAYFAVDCGNLTDISGFEAIDLTTILNNIKNTDDIHAKDYYMTNGKYKYSTPALWGIFYACPNVDPTQLDSLGDGEKYDFDLLYRSSIHPSSEDTADCDHGGEYYEECFWFFAHIDTENDALPNGSAPTWFKKKQAITMVLDANGGKFSSGKTVLLASTQPDGIELEDDIDVATKSQIDTQKLTHKVKKNTLLDWLGLGNSSREEIEIYDMDEATPSNIKKATSSNAEYDEDEDNTIVKVGKLSNKYYETEYEITLPKPKRSGYEFICWSTEQDGDGDCYDDGETIEIEDIILYAIWKEKEKPEIGIGVSGSTIDNNVDTSKGEDAIVDEKEIDNTVDIDKETTIDDSIDIDSGFSIDEEDSTDTEEDKADSEEETSGLEDEKNDKDNEKEASENKEELKSEKEEALEDENSSKDSEEETKEDAEHKEIEDKNEHLESEENSIDSE